MGARCERQASRLEMKKLLLTGVAALFNNYTQVILTVIAVALVMLVWQQHRMRQTVSAYLAGIETNIGAIGETLDGIEKQIGLGR